MKRKGKVTVKPFTCSTI